MLFLLPLLLELRRTSEEAITARGGKQQDGLIVSMQVRFTNIQAAAAVPRKKKRVVKKN